MEYLDELEAEVYAAIKVLEKERYHEYTWALAEIVRQAKHYQCIAESVLSSSAGVPLEQNNAEYERAYSERDWYRHPKISKEVSKR